MGVDWDADALRASKAAYPYTEGKTFNYFKDLVKPHECVLEVGCQIASWIWAWRDIEPTIRYFGLDWSRVALDIAEERYGIGGEHAGDYPAVFYNVDAREMDFEEMFDVAFTHTFFQHTNINTKRAVAPKIWEALKPNGLLIIQENTSYESSGTWLEDGWIKFFSAYGFDLVRTHDIGGGGTGFIFRKGPMMLNPGTPEHQWERHYSLRPGDTYVEAGAFWCRYGRIASTKVGSLGKVILIEPSPINISVIKKIIEAERLNNVTLVEKAVWSDRGRMKFCCMGNPAGHRLWGSPSDKDFVEVNANSIDNILDDLKLDHVDLFVADVENAEVPMIRGMERWLEEKRIKNIAIAAYHKHPDGNYAEISAILKRKRYEGIEVWGGVVYAHV
ncbi:hypothetical protein ES703_24940 [subsurface metagenome]